MALRGGRAAAGRDYRARRRAGQTAARRGPKRRAKTDRSDAQLLRDLLLEGRNERAGPVCTLDGQLSWISDPIDGSRHDTHCLRESGVLPNGMTHHWTGDKGYVGNGMVTPFKKPIFRGLLDWEKTFNTSINKIRYVIEQVIANFKTWRILHTDYRRPLPTFATTISAVVGLHFYLRS